jgi:iron(III) transport system permease protein
MRYSYSTSAIFVGALLIAFFCSLPIVGVVVTAAAGSSETLGMLARTVLGKYTLSTLILLCIVMITTGFVGSVTAWLVATMDFPGRRVFEVTLVLPLALPAYVLAYAYTDLLDHPGLVQTTLRDLTGWGPRDYWFPEIRSLGGAAAMLSMVLYPYVYLTVRTSLKAQSAKQYFAARALGSTPWAAFWKVSLPMSRPAIFAGVLLAAMETIADFGTVSYFGVQTYATGIYTSWFGLGDRIAAAQLSLGLFAFAFLINFLERASRGSANYHSNNKYEAYPRIRLTDHKKWIATFVCTVPILLGLLIPVITLLFMSFSSEQSIFSARYLNFIRNSFILAALASVFTVTAAIFLFSAQRLITSKTTSVALRIGWLGYAVPGGVVAVGLMIPLAEVDNAVDGFFETHFGIDTGLLFTGSIGVLIIAYMVRYLATALGSYESGLATVGPNMDAAARVLGSSPGSVLWRVHLPMLLPSIVTASVIVFVDVMKELPATLILRPFNYDTLAVQAFRLASDERLEGAAVPSLIIGAIGLIPVFILSRKILATSEA